MSSLRAVSVVTLTFIIFANGLLAQDFFDENLEDMDLVSYLHEHEDSDDHDLERHDSHGQNGIAFDSHSFKANGVFVQTSSGQSSHSGASNEHIDRGHDHLRSDGQESESEEDSLTTNEVPDSSLGQTQMLPPNSSIHVPDLTNHALAEHSQFTGLHGMPTPTVMPEVLKPNT